MRFRSFVESSFPLLPSEANPCYNELLYHEGVIRTGFDFLYNRLAMPKFFTSQWVHVKEFQNAIEEMSSKGIRIDNESVVPVMESILKKISDQETVDGVSVGTLDKGLRLLKQANHESSMDDNWFIRKFGQVYESVMKLRKNEDYVVNAVQMDRFLDLVQFFIRKSEEYGDKVEIEKAEPKQEFGGVTATFVVFGVRGDEVREFCKVLKYCSAISIDAVEDGVAISCTVPDVFVRKTD